MKCSLRWIALLGVASLLTAGCQKKDEAAAQVARDAESKLPEDEKLAVSEPGEVANNPAAVATGPASTPMSAGDQAAYEAWFKKYQLDLNDPKMLDADGDNDGFSNRDEFLADTDPHEKNSRPGIHKTIRLKEYNEVRLPLVLESVDGEKAHIRRTDQPESKAITVKAGDSLKGLPFKVKNVESKEDFDKGGEKINISGVALEDSSTKEKIVLIKDMPAKTAASYAMLVSPDGKTTVRAHKGDVFAWPGESGATYKVVDLSQDQVVLQQLETKKMWTIPRL